MPEYTGRKVAFGLKKEAVRGTAETAAALWLNHLSLGFYPRAEKALNESAIGVLFKNNDSTTMTKWGEGDFEVKATDINLGYLFHAAMGTVVTSDNADTDPLVKDHTFSFDQSNSPASYTFFRKDDNINEAYALGMVSQLELNSELGKWLQVKGSIITKPATSSSATVTRTNDTEFKPKHMAVRLAANTAGLGAASDIATLQSLRLTVDRAVDRDLQHGTDTPYDISVREIEISGEIVLRHVSDVHRQAFEADTQQAMRISIINTDVVIGAAANPGLVITLPKVTFDNWQLDQGLGDKVTQTIGFKALFDISAATAMSAVLTNTQASY